VLTLGVGIAAEVYNAYGCEKILALQLLNQILSFGDIIKRLILAGEKYQNESVKLVEFMSLI
jgi:hypothetical protein